MFFISLPSSRSSRSAHSTAALKRTTVLFSAGVSVAILSLAGCGFLEGAQSADSADTAPSAPAEKIMSGEYEVGPDGKLLNPKRNDLPKVPQKPIEMNQNNAEGAEAAARHFIDVVHYTWVTNETTFLETYSTKECDWCQEVINFTKTIKQNQGWIAGGEVELEELTAAFERKDRPGTWHMEFKHIQKPLTFYNGSEIVKQSEYVTPRFIIEMKFVQDEGWLVTGAGAENEMD